RGTVGGGTGLPRARRDVRRRGTHPAGACGGVGERIRKPSTQATLCLEGMMELHERRSTSRAVITTSGPDPFADVKNRSHLAVLGELGPQLFNSSMDPMAL